MSNVYPIKTITTSTPRGDSLSNPGYAAGTGSAIGKFKNRALCK
jgi:hypothetical protein